VFIFIHGFAAAAAAAAATATITTAAAPRGLRLLVPSPEVGGSRGWLLLPPPKVAVVLVLDAGAYTRPLFGSTLAHFVGFVGCMIFPQSIRQGDKGRCDQNGLG